jgi:hypothetical protein
MSLRDMVARPHICANGIRPQAQQTTEFHASLGLIEVTMCLFAGAEHEHLDAHDELEGFGWSQRADLANPQTGLTARDAQPSVA